jgi:uncharacterized membrane-anchored protein
MRLPKDHPQRYLLNNEIHARPAEEFLAPAQITFIAVLYPPAPNGGAFRDLEKLCEMTGAPPPRADANHFCADIGTLRLKWERHTEFATYTFSRQEAFDEPFARPAAAQVPDAWFSGVDGLLLVAIHLAIRDHRSSVPDLKDVAKEFSGNYLVGAKVGGGRAIVLTDFRVHEDGFSRMLLMDLGLGKRQTGRMIQRLTEIETYRMLALLALPVARAAGALLPGAERQLATVTSSLAQAAQHDEPGLLDQLTQLAAGVENQISLTSFRFGAARAYYALVARRIAELREERLIGVQTINEFMERRLGPAISTCESAARRLSELSERVARTSDLLRTRVDVEREQQNLALLASMDRRAKVQLRMQQTVEGLSVVAITYYAVGLVGYLADAALALGFPVKPKLVAGVFIPIIACGAWSGLRRLHKTLQDAPPVSRKQEGTQHVVPNVQKIFYPAPGAGGS